MTYKWCEILPGLFAYILSLSVCERAKSHCCGGGVCSLLCGMLCNGFSALSEALEWSTMSQGVLFYAKSESVADLLLTFSSGYFHAWCPQLLSWGFGWEKWLDCLL